jgi:hypothetical protein
MLINITPKRVVVAVLSLITIFFLYLKHIDYFFEKQLKKNSSIFLREIIETGYYRIPKTACPFETYQFYRELYELALYVINNKDIRITEIGLYDCPSTTMRMNGAEANDKKFYSQKFITCDVERRFKAYQYEYKIESNLLQYNNFNIYSLYRKANCINHDTFIANVNKYKNLFGIQIPDNAKLQLSNAAMFIIKNKNYYYLITETNGKQAGVDLHDAEERYLIFKKLTLEQLKTFDNGSYWKLIKEYNIRID